MKTISFIALLVIGGVIFYVSGGGAMLGISGEASVLPETTEPINATFMGDAEENPFFNDQQASE